MEQHKQQFTQITTIWLALVISVFLYSGLIFIVPPKQETAPQVLMTILIALSLTSAGAAVFVRKILIKKGADLDETIANYKKAIIAATAICETIALYGFTLHMLGGERGPVFGFMAIATIAMLVTRPNPSEYSRIIENTRQSTIIPNK